MLEYELRRSNRRTLSIEVSRDARLIVRAPMKMPLAKIEEFIKAHTKWIDEKTAKAKENLLPDFTDQEIAHLKEKAYSSLLPLSEYYASKMGVSYSRIGITSAKTRLGSCSKKGSINYSWRVMLLPREAWDYIVVHELCHLLHFDHSKAFWQSVEKHLPDYKERKKLIK